MRWKLAKNKWLLLTWKFLQAHNKAEFLSQSLTKLNKIAKMDQSKATISGGLPWAFHMWLSWAVFWVLFLEIWHLPVLQMFVLCSSLRLYLEIWGLLAQNHPSDPTYFENSLQTVMNSSAGRCLVSGILVQEWLQGIFVQTCQKLRVWGFGLFFCLFSVWSHLLLQGVHSQQDIYLVSNGCPAFFFSG